MVHQQVRRQRNDCAVQVLAALFGVSYSEARMLAFQCGWNSVRGMLVPALELVCEQRGRKLTPVPELEGFKVSVLFDRLEATLPLVVHVDRHVIAVLPDKTAVGVAGFMDYRILHAWSII